jgi:hypothetical protein
MPSKRTKRLRYQLARQKAQLAEVKRRNKFSLHRHKLNRLMPLYFLNDQQLMRNVQDAIFQDLEPFIELGSSDTVIEFPPEFSFCEGYAKSIRAIKQFATSLYEYSGQKITLDFSQTTRADTAALFVLQIVRLEFIERLSVLQKRMRALDVLPDISIKPPVEKDVMRLLLVCGFPADNGALSTMAGETTLQPLTAMGYYKGTRSQKHYQENKKGVFSTKVVNYLNNCLNYHHYQLTDDEKQDVDGIIGEILNNAEDHSGKNAWFMTANFSKELFDDGDEEVGEFNLTIMNLGNTIFEAFMKTREDNANTFNDVENYIANIQSQAKGSKFSYEELLVLATMQDQISRLKYKEPSRGTGTMRFINSFLKLSDYEHQKKNYLPNLSVFSGNVHLTCDNIYKPFLKSNVFCLSLNPEMDLKKPPVATHLAKLSEKFPGTLLSVKIYINKGHYDKRQ